MHGSNFCWLRDLLLLILHCLYVFICNVFIPPNEIVTWILYFCYSISDIGNIYLSKGLHRMNLMKLYHSIRSRTFYKVRSPLWLLITFSICCYESFFTPCKLSSWHIQNMLFIIDPGRQLNKGSILMGHSFLFIFHFASICGEHFWCNISTKHWILNSYFRQTFLNFYVTQLVHLYLTQVNG